MPTYLPNISEIGVIHYKAHKIPTTPEHLETLPEKRALANKQGLLILKTDQLNQRSKGQQRST